jgi:hypothetical protein
MPVLQELISEAIPSQKCHKIMSLILSGYLKLKNDLDIAKLLSRTSPNVVQLRLKFRVATFSLDTHSYSFFY